jgi:hypothetical protein
MPAFDFQASVAEGFGELLFDAGGVRAFDALEVECGAGEHFEAAFEHAA